METLHYLCEKSGGHPRNLLMLFRLVLEQQGNLPLMRTAAEQAVRLMSNDWDRALNNPAYYDVLRQVDRERRLPGSAHDSMLLYNLSVLQYINAEDWYAVNPVVKELKKFRSAPHHSSKPTRPKK